MEIQTNGAAPERVDFSKIKTSIPIPNLIEVQKKSYERFLQMDLLPNEREDTGLQTVFNSVFPISDFRGVSQLEFVDYSIGNWECKCGNLKGLHHLRSTCRNCGATIRTDPFHAGDVLCHHCGTFNKNVVTFCNKCGDPVGLQLKYDMVECQERGMTYAAPLKVTIRLTVYSKDPETGARSRPRHQGAGSLLRRNSADDGQRHLHHQRHRARHRLAVAPFARRVLRTRSRRRATSSARSSPIAEAGSSSNTTTRICSTSVSTENANSTARFSCARSAEDRRADSARVLQRQQDQPQGQEALTGTCDRWPDRAEALARHHRQGRRDHRRPGQEDHAVRFQGNSARPRSSRWKSPPTIWKAPTSPPTWSTCPPAKS